MEIIKILQENILKNYGLDLNINKIINQDRNNIYQGFSKNNKQIYFIKIESFGNLKKCSEIYKITQIINDSKNITTSKFILTKKGKILIYIKELNKIIIIFKWENLQTISIQKDISLLTKGIALFHSNTINDSSNSIKISKFNKDYMFGDIPKAQDKDRLKEIKNFYKKYSPDYNKLKRGIIHNDLHLNNLGKLNKKLFITDFEHIKYGPLISDIGVLILDFWNNFDINLYRIFL